jgi:hypothetical protein
MIGEKKLALQDLVRVSLYAEHVLKTMLQISIIVNLNSTLNHCYVILMML